MILDSSALVAILRQEDESSTFVGVLAQAVDRGERLAISAATLFEVMLVIDRLNDAEVSADADRLVQALRLDVVDVTEATAKAARVANSRFGKGNHPPRLNFGDCFTYALAEQTGEPLLFKGNDFAQTDVIPAV